MAGSAADRKRTRQAKAAAPGRSRRRSPKDAGAGRGKAKEADEASRSSTQEGGSGISRSLHGGDEGLFGAWKTRRTRRRVAGIAPRLEPGGKRRRLTPEPPPEGFRRGFGLEVTRKAARPSGRAAIRRATGEASASMRTRKETARLRPGRIRQGKRRRDFGFASSDPPGIGEGLHASLPRPIGTRTGLHASLRGPGEAAEAFGPRRAPKPPSERWPRHPATAVKAGTSGGRWRHRPPLALGRHRLASPKPFLRPQAKLFSFRNGFAPSRTGVLIPLGFMS